MLEWLNALTIGQIIEETLPILFYSAIVESYKEASKIDVHSFVEPVLETLIDKAIKISRNNEPKKYHVFKFFNLNLKFGKYFFLFLKIEIKYLEILSFVCF